MSTNNEVDPVVDHLVLGLLLLLLLHFHKRRDLVQVLLPVLLDDLRRDDVDELQEADVAEVLHGPAGEQVELRLRGRRGLVGVLQEVEAHDFDLLRLRGPRLRVQLDVVQHVLVLAEDRAEEERAGLVIVEDRVRVDVVAELQRGSCSSKSEQSPA